MSKKIAKDLVVALIALAAIMFYVELRMRCVTINGVEYEHVGVLEYNDKGNVLYMPVYKKRDTK